MRRLTISPHSDMPPTAVWNLARAVADDAESLNQRRTRREILGSSPRNDFTKWTNRQEICHGDPEARDAPSLWMR